MTEEPPQPTSLPAFGVSGFASDTGEHLAMIARAHAEGNTRLAVERLHHAIDALLLWQRLALIDGSPWARRPGSP